MEKKVKYIPANLWSHPSTFLSAELLHSLDQPLFFKTAASDAEQIEQIKKKLHLLYTGYRAACRTSSTLKN